MIWIELNIQNNLNRTRFGESKVQIQRSLQCFPLLWTPNANASLELLA